MERILLKRKDDISTCPIEMEIFDDIIPGLIGGDMYAIDQWGKITPLSIIIDLYLFPRKGGKHGINFLWFLSGHNKALSEKVQFYEEDTIEI